MKIAILYICTDKYNVFWKGFFESSEKKFLQKSQKEYFVFTDDEHLFGADQSNVHIIPHKYMGWPYDTLMRFEVFSSIEKELVGFDYIFFFNANMVINEVINEEEFLKVKAHDVNLIMVQHPGVYNKKTRYLPYCRDPKSTAFIPYNKGNKYVMGALNGGKAKYFIELINTLKNNTQIDLDNNVIALVHDESHLNKYIIDRNDVWIHTPEYCNAEVYQNLPFEKKIVMLDKSKYFDVDKLKGNKNIKEKTVFRFFRHVSKWVCCNCGYMIDSIKYGG